MKRILVCFLYLLNHNNTVVGYECVYKKHDEIMGEKFNSTIQISCKGSGVYDKYQLGHKVECCGGKEFWLKVMICCIIVR